MKVFKLLVVLGLVFAGTQSYGQIVDEHFPFCSTEGKTALENESELKDVLQLIEADPNYKDASFTLSIINDLEGLVSVAVTTEPKAALNISSFSGGCFAMDLSANGSLIISKEFKIEP